MKGYENVMWEVSSIVGVNCVVVYVSAVDPEIEQMLTTFKACAITLDYLVPAMYFN